MRKALIAAAVIAVLALVGVAVFAGSENVRRNEYPRAEDYIDTIVDGATGNVASGTTVDCTGIKEATFYARDSAGTSVVTPQVSPDSGTTWFDLNAMTLSGTTASVDAYPQLNGCDLLRAKVTSCSSCNVTVFWGGEK